MTLDANLLYGFELGFGSASLLWLLTVVDGC